jgi:16S rRNA (cytosine967-C5)-methyltransferase
MRHFSYLNSAEKIILSYQGDMPLAIFLKQFFADNRQMGSKDRKLVAAMVYDFYRLGHALAQTTVEERLLLASFLCETKPHFVLQQMRPEWNAAIDQPIEQKLVLAQQPELLAKIFPFSQALSKGVDAQAFVHSFLVQPKLFLRIRPGKHQQVLQQLQNANIIHTLTAPNTLALPNGTKVDALLAINKDVVVQDWSSQLVGEHLQLGNGTHIYDACAASGGKTLMAYDQNNHIRITLSDVRERILINLRKRFEQAGVQRYHSFLADLTMPLTSSQQYDVVIADVPCTGSGTWARTPEQLYFFKTAMIEDYVLRQQQIASNLVKAVRPGGTLIYITCSVFAAENESVVDYLQQKFSLQLLQQQMITGYHNKADSLFVAKLQKQEA